MGCRSACVQTFVFSTSERKMTFDQLLLVNNTIFIMVWLFTEVISVKRETPWIHCCASLTDDDSYSSPSQMLHPFPGETQIHSLRRKKEKERQSWETQQEEWKSGFSLRHQRIGGRTISLQVDVQMSV
ncbi:hypothetical protein AOLI_G00088780 [Acnodon oligacanthus]